MEREHDPSRMGAPSGEIDLTRCDNDCSCGSICLMLQYVSYVTLHKADATSSSCDHRHLIERNELQHGASVLGHLASTARRVARSFKYFLSNMG